MIIKTITCHNVYNYGASLQAFALQTFLEQKKHCVEIIDYRPDYLSKRYKFFQLSPSGKIYQLYLKYPFFKSLWALLQNRSQFIFLRRKFKFDYFTKKYLRLTNRRFSSIKDLKNANLNADLFIAGSDQIWNTHCPNGMDPAFYCAFEANHEKCISYAASFATSTIELSKLNFVSQSLANFRSISVREKTGVALAESMGYKADLVADPVFLLPRSFWCGCVRNSKKRKYVLVYDFLHNDINVKECVMYIAKKENLLIYSINDYSDVSYADINIDNAGPFEFLMYLKNAEYVVSTSFHATAFCTIFEKKFITFPLKGFRNSSRITDYLEEIGLRDNFVEKFDSKCVDSFNIKYNDVRKKIDSYSEKSRKWLERQLLLQEKRK